MLVQKLMREEVGAMEIDWARLRAAAAAQISQAYAPYSGFPVGAAALVDDGRIVAGCNVENASYGLTLCAECSVVSALHGSGGGRLVALTCINNSAERLAPCGRCRQLLLEHGGAQMLIDLPVGIVSLGDLLPHAFDSRSLGLL